MRSPSDIKYWLRLPKEVNVYGIKHKSTLKRIKNRILSDWKFYLWAKEVRKLGNGF